MQLKFNILFSDLYSRDGLIKLDQVFLQYVENNNKDLCQLLITSRREKISDSGLLIDLSYLLDEFIAKLFSIEVEVKKLTKKHNDFAIIYKCKRLFVQRYALKRYIESDIKDVAEELSHFIPLPCTDKKFAEQVMYWFENREKYKNEVELAAQYAVWRVKNKSSILFSTYKKMDHDNLISYITKKN